MTSVPKFKPGSLCVIVRTDEDVWMPAWLLDQFLGKTVTLKIAHYENGWWWDMDPPLEIVALVPTRTSTGRPLEIGSHEVCIGEGSLRLIKGPGIETEERHLDELDLRIAEAEDYAYG